MAGGNFGGLLLIASNSELVILAVEGFRVIKPMEWLIWFRFGCLWNEGNSEKARRDGGSGMDSETLYILGKTLGSLNTCHHPDDGQILTTIDVPASPLVRVCVGEVRRTKIHRVETLYSS